MLEKLEIKIYKRGNWVVEIIPMLQDKKVVEYYLYHVEYGKKLYMFGQEEDFNDDKTLIEYIENNIDEYINIYEKEESTL